MERFDNLRYGAHERHVLDVYRPKNCGKLPVIVSVHGGGWVYGDKDIMQFYCMSLAEHGFAVVNFSYRLAPEHKHPAMMTARGDFLVPQAKPFYDKLCALGVPAEYRCYGVTETEPTHMFHINIKLPIARLCNDEECAFFRSHLQEA